MSFSPTSRRTFLALAGGALALPRMPAAASASGRRFAWEFSIAPDRAAALLPPGVEAADGGRLRLEIKRIEPTGQDILEPEAWGVARLLAASRAGDREGWTPLAVYASNERALRVARERDGLPATPATVTLKVEAGRLEASVRSAGEEIVAVSAAVGAEEADDSANVPLLVWSGRPALSWQGPGGALEGADIHSLDEQRNAASARNCSDVTSSWADAESVAAWYESTTAEPVAPQRTSIAAVEAANTGPWSPLSYPTRRVAPLTPARLGEKAFEALQTRKEIQLGPLEACELDIMIPQEAHEAMLPPMCRSGGRPMLKLLGLRVHESELSSEPFQEAWLFAFAIVAGRAGWFAVSHITEPQGDAFYGREAFGYPTKLGSPDIVATPLSFDLTINRLGREVAYARGMFKGFATGTSLGQMPVLTLRAKPGGEAAEILFQPWTFQGRRSRVDPATLEVAFPGEKAAGMEQLSDPWSELGPLRPLAVSALDGAAMQRGPAESLLEWAEFGEYYRERCDGVLPWEPRPAVAPQPTFLVGGAASGPRS